MPHYTQAQWREILREARANVAGPRPSTTSRTTPYTEPQKREILRKARANVAGHIPHRTDQSKFKLVHKTYEPKDDDDDDTSRAATPVATASAQQPWWAWTDQRIEVAISEEHDFMVALLAELLALVQREYQKPLEREDRALKREVELLRRELTTLREEIRVARGLQDLHEEVQKARQELPRLPALEQRLRGEVNIARADITAKTAEMRHELEATRRTVSVLKARHSNTDFNLARFMRGMQNVQTNEIAYESANERMIIRQHIHPDAAKVLREFAAKIISDDDVVH